MKKIIALLMLISSYAYGQKISDLPSATTLGGTEVVAGVQASTTKKISINQIRAFVDASYWKVTGTTPLIGNTTIEGDNKELLFNNLGNFSMGSNDEIELGATTQFKVAGNVVNFTSTDSINYYTVSGDLIFRAGPTEEQRLRILNDGSWELEGAGGTDGQVPTIQSDGTMGWEAPSGGGTVIGDYVTQETPSGTVNGSNDTFTLANTPIGFVHVYVNGVLYEGGGEDYTLTTATIVFVTPPLTGWKIRVSYIK